MKRTEEKQGRTNKQTYFSIFCSNWNIIKEKMAYVLIDFVEGVFLVSQIIKTHMIFLITFSVIFLNQLRK